MHWKTHRNELFDWLSLGFRGWQAPSSLHWNPLQDLSCAWCWGHPPKEWHWMGSFQNQHITKRTGYGAGICAKTSQPSRFWLMPVFMEPWAGPGEERTTCPEWLLVSQLGAGGFSQQFQQIMGATPCAESGAAPKHCICVPPFSGDVQYTSVTEISGSSRPQTSKLYITRNAHLISLNLPMWNK